MNVMMNEEKRLEEVRSALADIIPDGSFENVVFAYGCQTNESTREGFCLSVIFNMRTNSVRIIKKGIDFADDEAARINAIYQGLCYVTGPTRIYTDSKEIVECATELKPYRDESVVWAKVIEGVKKGVLNFRYMFDQAVDSNKSASVLRK